MQLHSVLFPSINGNGYGRMARVLELSAAQNSPNTPLTLHRITDSDADIKAIGCRRKRQFVDNVRKTRHHSRIVSEAPDGQLLCLMDCDTMVLGDLSPTEDLLGDNDVAITYRPAGSQFVFNSGVVFVRTNSGTRSFYERWEQAALAMLSDEEFHLRWKPRWGGINQSAFGYLTSKEYVGCCIGELPCEIWNCEAETWKHFSDDSKIVHICGALRAACLHDQKSERPNVNRLADIWRSYEHANQHAC